MWECGGGEHDRDERVGEEQFFHCVGRKVGNGAKRNDADRIHDDVKLAAMVDSSGNGELTGVGSPKIERNRVSAECRQTLLVACHRGDSCAAPFKLGGERCTKAT